VREILRWHSAGRLEAFVSNRVFEPDTVRMHPEQVDQLRRTLRDYGIRVVGAVFRSTFSTLSGKDLLSGGRRRRSVDQMARFTELVGREPVSLHPSAVGRKLPNKIGDYDSLREHYANMRDVFIPSETHDYFHVAKRPTYERALGLCILRPAEFVAAHPEWSTET
jgi:hypothetical protein